MSYQRERDEFIRAASLAGLRLDQTLTLLRRATTLQRLAEAQCNGDYPADDGQRKVIPCTRCESLWARSSMPRDFTQPAVAGFRPLICQDCRISELTVKDLAGSGYFPHFQGDPRGAVLRLFAEGTSQADIDSGRERGIYVPARG
jgi:hypothetical protein